MQENTYFVTCLNDSGP